MRWRVLLIESQIKVHRRDAANYKQRYEFGYLLLCLLCLLYDMLKLCFQNMLQVNRAGVMVI